MVITRKEHDKKASIASPEQLLRSQAWEAGPKHGEKML